ncbi:hypothetical protein NEIRO02_0568 [Nematocida sp. AWRm79]|nr:hypothetical protein NEIRO02_0568 [Nematocida sp. AWRm79]
MVKIINISFFYIKQRMVQGVLSKRKGKVVQKKRMSLCKYKKIKRKCGSKEKEKRQIRNQIEEHLKEKSKRV